MAHGKEHGIFDLDFSTILGGLTSGGTNLKSMIESLYRNIMQPGGYFTGGSDNPYKDELGASYKGGGSFGSPSGGYNLENLTTFMGQQLPSLGEESSYGKGITSFHDLLQTISSSDILGDYTGTKSDINTEIGSQIDLLKKKQVMGGKGSRYGNIATGNMSRGQGGRRKYLSDYYDIQSQQAGMQTDLQEQLQEDFMNVVGQWQEYTK